MSDEEDGSPESPQWYRDWLLALKGFDERHRVSAAAIVGDPLSGCISAAHGTRYVELAGSVGGVFESICGSDWTRMMEEVGALAGGLRPRLALAAHPEPATIAVSAAGAPVAFTYDPATNSVVMPFGAALSEAEYEIEYRTRCE